MIASILIVLCMVACAEDKLIAPEPEAIPPICGGWRSVEREEGDETHVGGVIERVYVFYQDDSYRAGINAVPLVAQLDATDDLKAYFYDRYAAAITWRGTYELRGEVLTLHVSEVQLIAGQWTIAGGRYFTCQWSVDGQELVLRWLKAIVEWLEGEQRYSPILADEAVDMLRVMKRARNGT